MKLKNLVLIVVVCLLLLPSINATQTIIDNFDGCTSSIARDDGDTLSGGGCSTYTYMEFTDNLQSASIAGGNLQLTIRDGSVDNYDWSSSDQVIGVSKSYAIDLTDKENVNFTINVDRSTSGSPPPNSTFYKMCLEDNDGDQSCIDWRSIGTTPSDKTSLYSEFNMTGNPSFDNTSITKVHIWHRPQTLAGVADYRLDDFFDTWVYDWTASVGAPPPGGVVVTITDPENGGVYSNPDFIIPINWDSNVTCTDSLYNFDEEGNVTLGGNISIVRPNDQGTHNITIYCQSSEGAWGSAFSEFTIQVEVVIEINRPENKTHTTKDLRYFFGANQLTTFVYSVDGDANITHLPQNITGTQDLSSNNFSVALDGLHSIQVWANTSTGIWSTVTRYFSVVTSPLIIIPDFPNNHIFEDFNNIFIGANFSFNPDNITFLEEFGMTYRFGFCNSTTADKSFIDSQLPNGAHLRKKFDVGPSGADFCIKFFSYGHKVVGSGFEFLIFEYDYTAGRDPTSLTLISVSVIDKWNNSIIAQIEIFNLTSGFNISTNDRSGGWYEVNASEVYDIRATAEGYRPKLVSGVQYPATVTIQLDWDIEVSVIRVVAQENGSFAFGGERIEGAKVVMGNDIGYTDADGIASFWRDSRNTYWGEVSKEGYTSKRFSVTPEQGTQFVWVPLIKTNATLGLRPPSTGTVTDWAKILIFVIFILASLATISHLAGKIVK